MQIILLEVSVRKVDKMIFSPVKRGRGRLKRTLEEVVKRDFWLNDIFENLTWMELNGTV